MKSYQNEQWIHSTSARLLRIISEYLEPKARFDRYDVEDTIVFMGSARLVDCEQAKAQLKQAQETNEMRSLAPGDGIVRILCQHLLLLIPASLRHRRCCYSTKSPFRLGL